MHLRSDFGLLQVVTVRRFISALWWIALLMSPSFLYGQEPRQPVAGTPSSTLMEDGLRHLKEFITVANLAARDTESKRKLSLEMKSSVSAVLAPAVADKNLPRTTRDAISKLAKSTNVEALWNRMVDPSHPNTPSPKLALSGPTFNALIINVTRVLELRLSTFVISVASGLMRVPPCPANQKDDYQELTDAVLGHVSTLRPLMDSVGRIEVKHPTQPPTATLVGTAFVVDQEAGLVATACHVVTDIARFDPEMNKWVMQADAWLDFGDSEAHDPRKEFKVASIAFVPNIVGCDGALVTIDTTLRQPPPALRLASSEPTIDGLIKLVSIGYPSRDLTGADGATQAYFTCVRAATGDNAKFLLTGIATADEAQSSYHILAHFVPTTGGQSGSPILDFSDPNDPSAIGIHICCVTTAHTTQGDPCTWRNEEFMEEAVSVADLMRLYRQSRGSANLKPIPRRDKIGSSNQPGEY
jgi:V8-like Glu-specific endopeptidase